MKINNITLATTNYNVKPLKRNSNNVPNVSFKANHCCLPKRQNQTTSSFWSKLFHKNRNVKKNYNGLTRKSRKEYHCDEVTYSYKNNKEGLLFKVFENCTLDKNKNIKTASKIIYCYDNDNGLKNQFIINPKFCQNETLTEAESIIAVYNHNAKLDKVKIFSGVIFEQPENTAVLCKVIKYNKDDEKIIYTKDYINPLFCDDCRVSECDNSDNTSMTSESLDQELLYPSENWNEDVGENESCITAVNKKQLEIWLKISSEMRQEILQETKPDPDSPDSFESFYSNSSFRKNIDKLYPDRSSSSEPKGLVSDNVSPRTSSSDASKSKSINSPKSFQESQPTISVLERVKQYKRRISTANEQQIQKETPLQEALNVLSQRDYNFAQLKEQNEHRISTAKEQQMQQETPIETGNELENEIDDENFKPVLTIPKGIKFTYVKRSSDNEIAKQQEIPKPLENTIQQKGSNIERLKKTFENCNSDKPKTTLVKSQAKLRETARKVLEDSDSLLAQENRLPTMDELLKIFEKEAKKQPEPKSMTRSESPQKPNVILKPIREKIEKNKAQKDALEKLKKLKKLKARCNDLKEPVENYEKELKILEEKYKRKSSDAQNTNIVQGLKATYEHRISTDEQQPENTEEKPKSMTHSESPQKPNVILKPIGEKIEKKSSLQEKETAQSKLEKIENCRIANEKLKAKSEKLGQTLEELKKQSQQKMQKATLLQEKETAQSKLEKVENCRIAYEKLKAKSEKLGQTLEELKKQSQQKSLKEQENQGRLSNGTSKKLSPEMERLKNFFDSCSKPKAIQIQYKDLTNNE